MYYLIGLILGLIPEVLYFTLFLSYAKNLKGKKVKLFLLLSIAYFLCIMISQYQLLYYVAFVGLIYLILKFLYKKKVQIVDIFLIMYACCYLTVISLLIYFAYDQVSYWICYVINRLLLFVPFLFRKKFNVWYKKYYSFWNRDYENKKAVKSITLRNISLIAINCIIFIINMICLYISSNIIK